MAASYDYEDTVAGEPEALGFDPNFVPDSVKSFVVHLYRHIREKNVYEIHQMYETSFQTLSERMFKDTPWPSVDAVSQYVDNDHVFCLLYREMWFRHLYARLSPTLRQRIDSWDNYCSLFQVVLHGVVNMQLPNQWLWDMVDEFVYQFQSFCQYRAKMKNKTEQEIALLRQFDQAWNVYGVLNFLQALVEKSMIIQILEQEKEGLEQFTATDGYDYNGGSNVLKVLGYFSMVGLLRVHCLLGDYHTSLKCLLPIDISPQGVYTSVIGSHITTIYHYGFANLMLRRYVEAIREFNKILLYIYKTKQYHQKSPQYEQILKKNEQMYALLAICLSLCPQVKLVDETVNSQLREKYGEKMLRMQRYDDEAFALYDELFSYACPKFITPSAPSYEEPLINYNQDAYRLQLKLFLYEVKQQQLLSGVRTFLKVYSTISLGKLATYMEVDEPTLRPPPKMAAMNSNVLACNYAISGVVPSSELCSKLSPIPSLASPVAHKLPVIRSQQTSTRFPDSNKTSGNDGRRVALLGLAAALFTAAASASSADAGVIEEYLEKSKANKELNDSKRLATSNANFARAYTVQFGTCKFPENFTGCQDLAKQKKVKFLSEDLELECKGKDKFKCGSNVFWKW